MCLIDAIDTVYEQGLDQAEFEIIIVDDKYPAGNVTAQAEHERVFREIERRQKAEPEKYGNLRIIPSGENGLNNGPSKARNAAIKAAQFEFIAGLDADDMYVFDPAYIARKGSFLKRAMDKLTKDDRIALVDCGFYSFGNGTDMPEMPDILSVRDLDQIIMHLCMSNKPMFRRSDALHSFVGGYDESLNTREDSHFFAKYMAGRLMQGKKAWGIKLDEPYYLYRSHPQTADRVSNRPYDYWEYRIKTITDALPYYQKEYGVKTPAQISTLMSKRFRDESAEHYLLRKGDEKTLKESISLAGLEIKRALWRDPLDFIMDIKIDPRSAALKRLRQSSLSVMRALELPGIADDIRSLLKLERPAEDPDLLVMGIDPFLD
ncbi:MAG: glycosyltransferase [Alphaproteobacteria bacterium]|nr:glycosyltransferase [Alphaproteobacteria bacterium]